MPITNFRWLSDALARGGVPKEVIQTIRDPGRLSTDAIGQFNRIVSDTGRSAQATARNLTGAVQQAVAQSRGVNPQNPITGFNINSANPLGRGITAPTVGTGTPRPPVIRPTISGPAPNTFGAPYIRDPALARQFMKGGLPTNVPRSPVPGITGAGSRLAGVGRILGPLGSFLDVGINNYEASQQRNQLRQQNPGFLGQAQANLYGLAQTLTGGAFSPLPTAVTTFQEVYGLKSKPSNQAPPRVVRFPEDYKRTELEAGLGAEQFRPGAGFPGQQAPIPPNLPDPVITAPPVPGQQAGNAGAMQEYMNLKAKAKTPEDYQVLDELGMRIHQEKYGTPEQRKAETIGTFNPLLAQMGLPQPAQGAISFNPSAAFGNQMPGVNVSPYSGAYVPPVTNVPQLNLTNPSYGYQGIPSLGDQTNIGLPEDQKDEAQEFLRRLTKFNNKNTK